MPNPGPSPRDSGSANWGRIPDSALLTDSTGGPHFLCENEGNLLGDFNFYNSEFHSNSVFQSWMHLKRLL